MTSQSPRIYTYKITFEEVPYYYYGVKKEKYFNQEYWGTPITHKWVWDFYTPKKQILQVFPFTDEGWIEAQEVEKRLIRPVYNTDKWCLNESCGGKFSLETSRENGKKYGPKNGKKIKELGIGIHGRTKEQMSENGKKSGKKGGKKAYEMGIGIHGRNEEQRKIDAKKGGERGGKKTYETKVGCFRLSQEQKRENSKKGGTITKELGVGIHGRTKEQMTEDGKNAGKISGSQRWICTETGFITNAGNLTKYQRKRGIDTSKRKRIS
jgi:hypothetical protein